MQINFMNFLSWCNNHGFQTYLVKQSQDGSLDVEFSKGGHYRGHFLSFDTPEVWYKKDEATPDHLIITTLEELNKY